MDLTTCRIRNIAICGHGKTGKTTLVEQMLFRAGSLSKAESVESGHTASDFHQDEITHSFSIHTSLLPLHWDNKKINLLDSPGSADFVGEVISAFRAAETAVMLISAPMAIQIETLKLWRRLDARQLPRIVFMNKMDHDRADFHHSFQEIKTTFKVNLIPLNVPLGEGKNHEGIIDLLRMKVIKTGGKEEDIPQEKLPEILPWREKLIEMAAEGDDTLTEKFLTQETLEGEDILKGLAEGMADNTFVPLLCGSAKQGSGISDLLDIFSKLCPAPGREAEPLEEGKGLAYDSNEDLAGFIFKTSLDKFSGKISYVKVVQGIFKAGELYSSQEGKKTHLNKVYTINGKNLKEVPQIIAGDLGGILKMETLHTNASISKQATTPHFKALALPFPVHSLAINAENPKDEDKMNSYLHKIAEQDLTFTINFNKETNETVIAGMGEIHINGILEKMQQESKITAVPRPLRIPYREAMTKSVEVEYTHKKQTGGHGQYARVCLRVSPLKRGEIFSFENTIRGAAISRGYMPGIVKGLREAMQEGFIAGYPVVDIHVNLFDGKEHPVDSSEMAFKLAAKHALKIAFEQGEVTLLEPLIDLTVFTEEMYLGDVLADLSSKRGRVQNQASTGKGIQTIQALVPQGELRKYMIDLKSLSSGTGTCEMTLSQYKMISGKIADKIIMSAKRTAHP